MSGEYRTCQRCPYRKPRRSVVVQRFTLLGQPYEVALCRGHRDDFERLMGPWARCADEPAELCQRCGRHRGVAVRQFTVGDMFELMLCSRHRDEFDRAMKPWAQVATMLETGLPRRTLAFDIESRQATARINELRAKAVEAARGKVVCAPAARQPGSVADTWVLTKHARERAEERGFTPEQMLAAAVGPEIQRPSTTTPGTYWRVLGNVAVSVNPSERVVLTVVNRFDFLCRTEGEEKADAYSN